MSKELRRKMGSEFESLNARKNERRVFDKLEGKMRRDKFIKEYISSATHKMDYILY